MNWVVSESPNQELRAAEEDGISSRSTLLGDGDKHNEVMTKEVDSAALIDKLRVENAKLHALLVQLKADVPSLLRTSETGALTAAVHPSEFVPGEHSVIFVCADKDQDSKSSGAFVAVMDVNDDEWWEVIDPEKDCAMKQPELIDSDYVLVEDKQVISALSQFVARTLKSYPESKAVPPAQLKKLLDQSFSTLQEKGMMMKVYDWASFAYTSYGWASYGWALYQDPTVLKMVAKWSFSAASWIIFLL